MKSNLIILAGLGVLLSGCSSMGTGTRPAYLKSAEGNLFVLHETIRLPAERYTVFLQGGSWNLRGFNRFEPHCQLKARGVSDGSLRLIPRSYEIEKIIYSTPIYVENKPIQIAAKDGFRLQASRDNDAPSDVISVVEMKFRQDETSRAWGITCGGAQDYPSAAEPPSIGQIRSVLGKVASLQLPGESNNAMPQ